VFNENIQLFLIIGTNPFSLYARVREIFNVSSVKTNNKRTRKFGFISISCGYKRVDFVCEVDEH
jgi:hypothetical protein